MPANAFTDFLANSDWGSMLLSQLPQAAYFSSPTGQEFGSSPRRGRYFQQAYNDVYSQYMGNIGSSMRSGQAPATFQEFLQTDPWTKRYGQLPQFERGVTKTYTDPRTRFIFY